MKPDGTAGEYEYNEREDGGWRILELKITLLQCVYACVYVCVCMYVYVHSAKDQMSQELDCILTVSFGEEK